MTDELISQFISMTEAQKTYILSVFTNKILQNPKDYGLGSDGVLRIGDNLDLSNLLRDEDVRSIFDKAKQTIIGGSLKEKSILANNEKISRWVESHPKEILTSDKVSEILSSETAKSVELKIEPPKKEKISDQTDTDKREVETAKKRLEELERQQEMIDQKTKDDFEQKSQEESILDGGEVTKITGIRSMAGDISFTNKDRVEQAFQSEINEIYGKRGFWGVGKVDGLKTKEWGFIKGLPVNKVLEYFNDPNHSSFSINVINELAGSVKHGKLIEQINGLMSQANTMTGVEIKPYDNGESVEAFMRRLGEFIMKRNGVK